MRAEPERRHGDDQRGRHDIGERRKPQAFGRCIGGTRPLTFVADGFADDRKRALRGAEDSGESRRRGWDGNGHEIEYRPGLPVPEAPLRQPDSVLPSRPPPSYIDGFVMRVTLLMSITRLHSQLHAQLRWRAVVAAGLLASIPMGGALAQPPAGPPRTPPTWTIPVDAYYPEAGNAWETRSASRVGLDSVKLAEAIQFAIAAEARAPRDQEIGQSQSFGREPFGFGIGPFRTRGAPSGVILRRGYVVAEWGEPENVDMTHSVTKSFLSTVVGVAVDKGLIRSVRDTVANYVGPILAVSAGAIGLNAEAPADGRWLKPFESAHNRRLTWDDMLRQVSDWEGTLWGKPDWADRPAQQTAQWLGRVRTTPGSTYEYNDVRVNVLALAALNVWRRPLPEVLREHIMDPIGASPTWRWYGYDNSWVVIDGRTVQAVSGGGHWGGGMFINARDMARFGLLTLRRGQWKNRRLLSEAWVSQALTPTSAQLTYGYMNWFLNTDKKYAAAAPANAFFHVGNGTNIIYCDPTNDIVAVVRWIENGSVNGFVEKLLAAVQGK